jgi:MarC family membrane protein
LKTAVQLAVDRLNAAGWTTSFEEDVTSAMADSNRLHHDRSQPRLAEPKPGAIRTMEVLSAAVILFLVMDPIGNVPLFLSLLKNVPGSRRYWVLSRELLIALAVLLLFLLFGRYALELLHLRQESIRIAGGIVLLLIGIKMIFPTPEGIFGESEAGEPFIVPMAIPCIAGPSAMAVLMLLGNQNPSAPPWNWIAALLIAWLSSGAVLFGATALFRLLGGRMLAALERLMGMILVALSVQMLLDGLVQFLKSQA